MSTSSQYIYFKSTEDMTPLFMCTVVTNHNCYFRKMKEEGDLQKMLWKIQFDELNFTTKQAGSKVRRVQCQ